MSNLTNKKYDAKEIEWLRAFYPSHSLKETVAEFNRVFGVEYTESMIRHRLVKNGIKNNKDTRFQKECIPHNKGKGTHYRIRTGINTQFKKGVLPKNTRPVGSIYKSKDQNLIKIAMPNKWVQLSRYNYEKAYSCKLTSKDKILHLNGNKFDDDVDNLVVVNNQILARLCKQKYIFADRELTRVCVTKEKLLQKIKELENE